MAREIDADVYEPRWVQGCADPEYLGPKSRLYVYSMGWIFKIYMSPRLLPRISYSLLLQCKANVIAPSSSNSIDGTPLRWLYAPISLVSPCYSLDVSLVLCLAIRTPFSIPRKMAWLIHGCDDFP